MNEKIYTVLISPVVTEKTARLTEAGKYTFFVLPSATKKNIKDAVEKIYGTDVDKVNIVKAKSKSRWGKTRKAVQKRTARTKAIVTIKDKKSIDLNKIQ
ncbi:MAG: 50S ribosomal protein L23 [Candidatus Peregrinibacteria bacterium]|nr:50S ribosomal protein L23 [Candidatus Peregrinibacteria bacterium]MDZ4245428.1 50S ribosomal protein L23 [Candidatus Gracilibacteria bacterium]